MHCTTGAVCVLNIWVKRMCNWLRSTKGHRPLRQVGSGTLGSMATPGFLATVPFSIRLAMASTRPTTYMAAGLYMVMAAVTVADMDEGTDMDRPASTVRSPGDPMAVPSKVVVAAFTAVVVASMAARVVVGVVRQD